MTVTWKTLKLSAKRDTVTFSYGALASSDVSDDWMISCAFVTRNERIKFRIMYLEDTTAARKWLSQFQVADREVARQLLRKLTLVSESEFDEGLLRAIEQLLSQIPGENMALFSITEPPNPNDEDGIRRVKGASADRVKHLLENVLRLHGNRVRANPTVESMRADRIKNIVLVEDFVGSGDRVTGFWRSEVSGSVKSWVSWGWVKVWLVTYAGIEAGILHAVRKIPSLTRARALTVLPLREPMRVLTLPMREIAQKYGTALRGSMWGGYSGGGGTVVFQHGCPNNAPAILWAPSKRFQPLFPNRGVPSELQACFGRRSALGEAENLWESRQYMIALRLIDEILHQRANPSYWYLVLSLALASTTGKWDDAKIGKTLQLPGDRVSTLRKAAYAMNLIDKQTHQLSPFGKDLLGRLRQGQTKKESGRKAIPSLADLYYPHSCEGVPKH